MSAKIMRNLMESMNTPELPTQEEKEAVMTTYSSGQLAAIKKHVTDFWALQNLAWFGNIPTKSLSFMSDEEIQQTITKHRELIDKLKFEVLFLNKVYINEQEDLEKLMGITIARYLNLNGISCNSSLGDSVAGLIYSIPNGGPKEVPDHIRTGPIPGLEDGWRDKRDSTGRTHQDWNDFYAPTVRGDHFGHY